VSRTRVPGFWCCPAFPLHRSARFEYCTAPNERAAKKLEARLMTERSDGRRKGTKAKTVADLMEHWFEWRKHSGDPVTTSAHGQPFSRATRCSRSRR
jgi:hypothetical protein